MANRCSSVVRLVAWAALAGCAGGGDGDGNAAGEDGAGGMAASDGTGGTASGEGGSDATGGAGDGSGGDSAAGATGTGGDPVGGDGGSVNTGGTSTGGNAATGGSVGTGGTPPANVPCSQRAYCNDFEDVSAGSQPSGSNVSGGNTLAVATDKAFSGTKSLKIRAVKDSARFSINLASKLKNPKKIAYARMMIWLDNTPIASATDTGHWDLLGMSGRTDGGKDVTASVGGALNSKYSLGRWLYIGGGADCAKQGVPQAVPLKKWTCLEVKINEEDALSYSVNIDGKEMSHLSFGTDPPGDVCVQDPFKGIWHLPKVQSFTFGWNQWHDQPQPVTMWIDDIVVDQVPIGCPQ